MRVVLFALLFSTLVLNTWSTCQPCYNERDNINCGSDANNISAYTMHMSVHPHLDAFWIFDFESYYNPQPSQGNVLSYFRNNKFHSVKQIFDTITRVLMNSKKIRQTEGASSQKAHRSFFNSQMGFFKRWYFEQNNDTKKQVQELLKTKYWEIVGGGYVEHDEGCAYYDDIIQNYQIGLRFLKEEFGYFPRAAVSADSFGHSQSTLAILAHLGVEGFFVQRSDEHILLQNKTEFIWKAKSANGRYYGALPTHIRWAIHGFEDQFRTGNANEKVCQTKGQYIQNLKKENEFLKKILKSNHIMRYFGHDFQQFDENSYHTIEGMMEAFSMQKCNRVTAVYGNPTQYFMTLMGEVFNKVKPIATRQEDIMPIWDYDSALYWTGYYTTDPYHKKNYRDAGKYLYAARKAFTPSYLLAPSSEDHKISYGLLQEFAETVSYLQHHDGISGTSRYLVMDKYEQISNDQIAKIKKTIFQQMFENQFPINTNNPIFDCSIEAECSVPNDVSHNDIYLKIFKTGGSRNLEPIIVHLEENQNYEPECDYEINCMCTGFPCACDLYLYPKLGTYNLIRLRKIENKKKDANILQQLSANQIQNGLKYNKTHLIINHNNKQYNIGYKKLNGDATSRSYQHLSRYGQKKDIRKTVKSGKYALGNYFKTEANLSTIRKVLVLQSDRITKFVVLWARDQMKTLITIPKQKSNQWKVQTLSSAEHGKLEDLYLEINAPHIKNNKKFYTDSNGWLVLKRELFKHEDYKAQFSTDGYDDVDGNSYPITAFVYIQDEQKQNKLSVNTDRPQGVIALKQSTIWINYDRLSSDDGKWVDQDTYKSQYQKFTHYITVDNKDNNERTIQKLIDEPLIIQGNSISPNERVSSDDSKLTDGRLRWQNKTGINGVKFSVKPWNDSSLLLRVNNMRDEENRTIELFSSDRICTLLTAYYGNSIRFDSIVETNIAGNMEYKQFIDKKWNWQSVVNLTNENQIFNKQFAETINLRPLEIRTFVLTNVSIDTSTCKPLQQLNYNHKKIQYNLDTAKPMPKRSLSDKQNEERVINYLLNEDKCTVASPILKVNSSIMTGPQTDNNQHSVSDFNKNFITNNFNFEFTPSSQQWGPNTQTQNKPLTDPMQQQKTVQQDTPEGLSLQFNQLQVKVKSKQMLSRSEKEKYFRQISVRIKKKIFEEQAIKQTLNK